VDDVAAMAAEPATATLRPVTRAVSGAAATLVALGVAELVGLAFAGNPSLVGTTASRVIDAAPDAQREAVISAVGTADKPLLAVAIVVVVGVIGAVVGRFVPPRQVPVTFAVLGIVAWALLVGWSSPASLPLFACTALGVLAGSLTWLLVLRHAARRQAEAPAYGGMDRRSFLGLGLALGAAGAAAVAAAGLTRQILGAGFETARAHLPVPRSRATPAPAGATPDVPGIAPAVTPNADFYQIDTALVPPVVSPAQWRLTIDGRVGAPLTLTYDQLLAMPSIERYVTLTCVSNEVGGDLVGNALWQGVPLADLLARVGVRPDADALVGESVDGFTAGFPLSVLKDGRDAMVAYAMNGDVLPVKHGYPARLVIPGLYGYVSATKWLSNIHLTTLQETVPFWVEKGWSQDGTIQLASRVDVPRFGAKVPAGRITVGGRAWHQHQGVAAVQVRIDDDPTWHDATLADDIGIDSWRLWSYSFDAAPGAHSVEVRAQGADGVWQSEERYRPFPGASSGLNKVPFEAT